MLPVCCMYALHMYVKEIDNTKPSEKAARLLIIVIHTNRLKEHT